MTKQMEQWSGIFGTEYTNRNNLSLEELDNLYLKTWGG